MSEVRPPILRSKLRPPTPADDLVERGRLIDRLAGERASVWALTAPAGFGKTTLLARALAATSMRVAWLSVDSADDSPVRFWSHVAAALEETGVPMATAVEFLLGGDVDRCVDEIVAAIEQVADGEGPRPRRALVLEDLHEISDERILSALSRLVATPPDGLVLVLSSRQELDVGLNRGRLGGWVVDMSARDLAFTSAEAESALAPEIRRGALTAETASAVIERLEGWPAGIRLTRLAIRRERTPLNGDSLLAGLASSAVAGDFLASEVLGSLDPDTRTFLEDICILDDLTPGLCDAVSGRQDSLAVLRELAADQVFTSPLDAAPSTFRLHRILRDHLRSEIEARPPQRTRERHRRAMRWYRSSGDVDAVVRHAVSAGEHDVALATFGEAVLDASNRGQIDDMWRWIHEIGSERVLADGTLAAIPAWVSLNQRRYDEIEPWLEAISIIDDVPAEHLRHFAVHAATVRANRDRHLGHLDRSLAHAREALRLLDAEEEPPWTIGPTVHATLAQALALTGHPEAEQVARCAIGLASVSAHEPPLVMAYSALGSVVDDPAAALAAADSALSMAPTSEMERFHRPALAWFARARAELKTGRVADAGRSAQRSVHLADSGDEPAVAALSLTVVARVAHLLGDDDERRAASHRAESIAAELDGGDWLADQVRRARNDTRFAPGLGDHLPVGARELTERELVVLRLLPFGLTRRELATQLYISENTVKTHLLSIRRKLGVVGRGDVVERATELGLVEVDPAASEDG